MKAAIKILLCLILLSTYRISALENREEIVSIAYTIKVAQPETVRKDFIAFTEKRGGHFQWLDDSALHVRIPASVSTESIMEKIVSYGVVIREELGRRDISEKLAELRSGIGIQEKHLANLAQLFSDTNFAETLALEKEITETVDELEKKKGELGYQLERMAKTDVTLRFEFKPVRKRNSVAAFDWINDISIPTFLRDFRIGGLSR